MTSKEKIKDILDWVQTNDADWHFMQCLKQELEILVVIAQTEGIKEAHNIFKKGE